MNRYKLLLALALMPEEAFSYFVVWSSGRLVQYPDGLGGFMPDSRDSIAELRAAANEYITGSQKIESEKTEDKQQGGK